MKIKYKFGFVVDKYKKLQVKMTHYDVLIHRNIQDILKKFFPVMALVADPIPAAVTLRQDHPKRIRAAA